MQSKYKDYINCKFGELTIVDVIKENQRYKFVCDCSCGEKNKIVQVTDILSGKVKTCGSCLANKLVGKKIDKLLVIERVNDSKSQLKCLCDCGNIVYYKACVLNSGKIHSCGKCPINTYEFYDTYVIGYTFKGEKFYFDLDDYDVVSQYVWRLHHSGYVVTSLPEENGHRKILTLHNLVFGKHCYKVDHINRNKQDNRKNNLRLVSNSLNGFNINKQINNTSGKTGVSYLKKNNCYTAYIGYQNETIYLGSFKDYNDAVRARKQAEMKYYGELSDTRFDKDSADC